MRYNVLTKLCLYHKKTKESIAVELESTAVVLAIESIAVG